MAQDFPRGTQVFHVHDAAHLLVASGANLGDALSFAEELVLDDVYQLTPFSREKALCVATREEGVFRIVDKSETGRPGADLHLDCAITLMSPCGQTTECLVLVELDDEGHVATIHVLALAPLEPKTDYVLVGIDTKAAMQRLAQSACISFTRGTMITMADGALRPIEEIKPGDMVLTRDDGAQPVRWLGQHTTRALGSFAPIRIAKGALNNIRDLVVAPDHRLFIYQRRDELGLGRTDAMVRARHLLNGRDVTRESGGFVDYYQMLFDAHQIVYAEGIAVETMLVDQRTKGALPHDLGDSLPELISGHRRSARRSIDVKEHQLARPDATEALRRSSLG